MRADYGAWNSLNMSDAELRALADAAEAGNAVGDLSAGWSSGSGGGTRGLFVASSTERADYIGQSLARLLPARALLKRQRLALHLRANNDLYRDVQRGRFAFAHFPLETSLEETIAALMQFDPTILIAPPHRLIAYAKVGLRLPSLRHLFCGSEPISQAETEFLTEAFGVRPGAIYQATEGFLGAECPKGRLHLNEHAIEFELKSIPATDGFRPVITDLRRTSQPIVRLRGDDYLELDPKPCPCGYGGRVVRAPQGRVRDIWHLGKRVVTPPQVVGAVETILGGARDWQAEASSDTVTLRVAADCSEAMANDATMALGDLTGLPVELTRDFPSRLALKRRKVVWNDG